MKENSITPIKVERLLKDDSGSGLRIEWSNGSCVELDSDTLRKACPCASCQEKRGDKSHSKPLSPGRSILNVISASSDEELNLEKIWPVGNYALGMRWADSHDSGIYTYKHLWEISQETNLKTSQTSES